MSVIKEAAVENLEQNFATDLISLRKTAFVAGVLYLITFVSIPTLSLYSSVHDPNYIVGFGPDTSALIGALLELIVAFACIGTAITLFPILMRQNEGVAVGFVASRILEAAAPGPEQPNDVAVETADGNPRRKHSRSALFKPIQIKIDS
jgi:hypothetical protein